ncbi:hypothetical protein Taro_018613, partial [Colocasia esculenta]|nr:hypothetical protein [Colocasia esculenta]
MGRDTEVVKAVLFPMRLRQENRGRSQAGEQREWLVCPPLGCQWWCPVLGCQYVVESLCVASRPRGVSGVRGGSACGPSTLWRSEVSVLVVRRPSHVVAQWSSLDPYLGRHVQNCFHVVPDSIGFCGSRFLLLWPVFGPVGGGMNFGVPGRVREV